MQKGQDTMRSLATSAICVAAAVFLLWRAETYVDAQGHGLLLARFMCICLGIMIGMVGLMHGLEALDAGNSTE
jgi:hypothetical protein